MKKIERREIKKKFKEWSKTVRERDGNRCIICDIDKYIQAHHVFPREIEELRFVIDNGVSLCPLHHKYSKEISAHKNPFAFFIWLQNNRKEQYERLIELYKTLDFSKGKFIKND